MTVLVAACGTTGGDAAVSTITPAAASDASNTSDAPDTAGVTADGETDAGATVVLASSTDVDLDLDPELGGVGSLDSTVVHEISITFDEAAYDAMITAYRSTGDKEWIEATVTIDGVTYEQVGLRLKGNSSLFGLNSATGSSADDPATLPWLIKLDEYVDDQSIDGLTELVVRSNSTETALNEAVALELLDAAGLASQDAIAASLSINGSDAVLRLVIDNPDDTWMAEEFGVSGALYKAESSGDYSYRGDDAAAYDEVFDQEAGKDNTDLTPLIEFLDFVNNSDDATFAAELGDHLDVDAFATYLAYQQLIDNMDDIDGPGNNSYLYYDLETGSFTVVSWDLNLAFGTANVGQGGTGGAGGLGGAGMPEMPEGMEPPTGGAGGGMGGGMGGPGGMDTANVLVDRFLAVDEWQALVDAKVAELQATLYDSGLAAEVLDAWSTIVSSSGLVDDATVASEAAAISEAF
jgi:spore coat protein CotH